MEFQLGKMKVKKLGADGKTWWRIRVNGHEYYTDMKFVRDIVKVIEEIEKRKEVKA